MSSRSYAKLNLGVVGRVNHSPMSLDIFKIKKRKSFHECHSAFLAE